MKREEFNKQFPNLKDEKIIALKEYPVDGEYLTGHLIDLNRVINYCLDKQRVKEAIDKSTFIEHLTDKQQKELFDIVVGK